MTKTARTELYLIRHAETVMNTNAHLVGGRSNETPLTARGIEQAKTLGRAMLANNIIPDKVFASPAVRTRKTARYSLDEMGLDIEPTIHDDLQELSQGHAEGKPRVEIFTEAVLQNIAKVGKDFKLEGGESMNEVGQRMHDWVMQATAGSDAEAHKYFVYTHGGAIKYLASHILGWEHAQTYQTAIDNTSVNLFVVENNICEVAYLNQNPAAL